MEASHVIDKKMQGDKLYEEKRYEEAIEIYSEALKSDSNNIEFWSKKSLCLRMLSRFEEALEACEKALELNSEYAYALKIKADILRKKNQYTNALEIYDKLLQVLSKKSEDKQFHSNVWNNKGIALYYLIKKDEAFTSYEEALKLHPENDAALNNKAMIQNSKKLYNEAIESYEKAIEISPLFNVLWSNIITALFNLLERYESFETSLNEPRINVLIKISCTYLILNNLKTLKSMLNRHII